MIDKIINWTTLICSIVLVGLVCALPFVNPDTLVLYFLTFGIISVIASWIRIKRV